MIEVLLASSLVTVFFVSFALYYTKAAAVTAQTTRYIQSSFLLEEGIEVVKGLRDDGWGEHIVPLTNGTTYYLSWNGTAWSPTTTPSRVENFYARTFVLSAVNRDGSDDIAVSGTNDPGTRKLTMSVAWNVRGATTTRMTEAYIVNLFE